MIDSEREAFQVAGLPTEYNSTTINQLFDRGYQHWTTDGTNDTEGLIDDIERFGYLAINGKTTGAAFVDTPGQLAIVATLAGIVIEQSPRFQGTARSNIQPIANLCELYAATLKRLIREYGDPTLHQELAEIVYRKEVCEHEPYLGRICTDVIERERYDRPAEWYLEIPMTAASQKCIVASSSKDEDEAETPDSGETLVFDGEGRSVQTEWANNCVYVPLSDLDRRLTAYLVEDRAIERLLDVHSEGLSTDQHEWLESNVTEIPERIAELGERGYYEQLWVDWEPGHQLVKVVTKALKNAPEMEPGEYYPAQDLYQALELYPAPKGWERAILSAIEDAVGLGRQLQEHAQENSAIEVEPRSDRNQYKVGHAGSAAELEVTELEDLFTLPCFARMEERLHEKGPVRKDLYNFVRMAWWLPQYGADNEEQLIEDVKETFSRWEWFDPRITERQTRYELNAEDRFDEDHPPFPMSCTNEDVERYCIGRDVCPYSIYGSLPFREELHTFLDASSDGSSS